MKGLIRNWSLVEKHWIHEALLDVNSINNKFFCYLALRLTFLIIFCLSEVANNIRSPKKEFHTNWWRSHWYVEARKLRINGYIYHFHSSKQQQMCDRVTMACPIPELFAKSSTINDGHGRTLQASCTNFWTRTPDASPVPSPRYMRENKNHGHAGLSSRAICYYKEFWGSHLWIDSSIQWPYPWDRACHPPWPRSQNSCR